jgi:uncharacterized protein (TIGR02145 family)
MGERGTDGGTNLKATSNWNSGGNATDNFGFSALPGGGRYSFSGSFYFEGYYGYWWSSTETGASSAWSRLMMFDYGSVFRYAYDKRDGYSVRCVKD